MKLTLVIAVLLSFVALGQSEDIPPCPVCPSDIYLPDYNCSRFWQCSNGIATLKECPYDFHFNADADVCDWMWNFKHDVPCRRWTVDDLVCKAPETTTNRVTIDPSDPPPCPKHCPYFLRVPDVTCCRYFWQCDQGRAYRQKCPDGLVFDPEAKVCDIHRGQKKRGWTSEDLICHDIATQTPLSDENLTTKLPGRPHCPVGCSEQLNVSDPNCTHWWVCSNGTATKMTCPDHLWWDSIRNICAYPELAYCDTKGWDDNKLKCPPSTTKMTSTTTETTSTSTKITSTTTKITSTTTKITSTTTKSPSTTTRKTSSTSTTTCACPISEKPPKCPAGVNYLKNPDDCKSYYQCTTGGVILMHCPDGLYWNAKGNYCDWPKTSGCKQPT
ncbi:unnamed protein product [Ceutorhynchus assimilis]|uniref:Chitin-binding type-2 domain-containing protein n=1 Tax=Ceutorhynchus assimilis TaxID=467358 RepID=A0A9N9MJP0_9CUCU|nr:unnamed protein product [Ceutorhynchus assimilis]